MKTTSLKLSALASALLLAGCGGSSTSDTANITTNSLSKISGTVPGTLIEAFCEDGSYYAVKSTDNNTNEHPFEIEVPSNVSCSLVMTTNEDDETNRVVTQIGMITPDANGTLFTAASDIDLGYIPLAMDPSDINDANGDHVSDDILNIQVDGTSIVVELDNPLDDDDDGLVNVYEDDDKDSISNYYDEDDDNDGIDDIFDTKNDINDDDEDSDESDDDNENVDSPSSTEDSDENDEEDSSSDSDDTNHDDEDSDENDSNDDTTSTTIDGSYDEDDSEENDNTDEEVDSSSNSDDANHEDDEDDPEGNESTVEEEDSSNDSDDANQEDEESDDNDATEEENEDSDENDDTSDTTTEILLPTAYTADAGRLLGSQCAQCHGTNGISVNSWDSIAGEDNLLDEIYEDDEPIMNAQAHGYTSEEIILIGNWLKTLNSND